MINAQEDKIANSYLDRKCLLPSSIKSRGTFHFKRPASIIHLAICRYIWSCFIVFVFEIKCKNDLTMPLHSIIK